MIRAIFIQKMFEDEMLISTLPTTLLELVCESTPFPKVIFIITLFQFLYSIIYMVRAILRKIFKDEILIST